MTDGPGPTPDVPPGWAAEQPPPYGQTQGSWAAPGTPGQHGGAPGQPGTSPSGQPYGPPPGAQYGGQPGYGPPYGGYPAAPYGFRPQAPRPGIIPLRPLNLGEILDGAIRLIRSNPRVTLGLSAIAAAITVIPTVFGSLLSTQAVSVLDYERVISAGDIARLVGEGLAFSLVSSVLSFVVSNILTGILIAVLGRAVFGARMTAGEAWQVARPRIWALLGLSLLTGLLIAVPVVIMFIAIVVIGVSSGGFSDTSSAAALALLLPLFVIVFLVYYAFIATKLALATSAVVLERRGVVDSMRRSWRLVNGGSWRVFGILALTSLLSTIFTLVMSGLFTGIGSVFTGTGTVVLGAVMTAIGSVLAAMVVSPFTAGVHGLLYADRRMRAEAFDLVLQTAAARNQEQGVGPASVDDFWHPSYAASAGSGMPGAAPYGGFPGQGPTGYGQGYGNPGTPPYGPQQ
jgi:hypothetical protein